MKKATSKVATKPLSKTILTLSVLFCLSINANIISAQNDTIINVIPEGVEITICFPDFTKRRDTLTVEQYIQTLPQDAEQRNRNLRLLNQQMKKPE